jgi:hypothetical protein
VHGQYSTLLIANGDAGIVAYRQLPFGTLMLANAYASEYGLSLEEASAALKTRSRLPPPSSVKGGVSPEHSTATFAALSPLLKQLHDDVAATLDYFRYQRLAGRPAHLSLTFTAPPIAGLDGWLAEALEVQVDLAANALCATEHAPETAALNLLEGSRSGLLKLGNQPYEFSHGRFVPIKGGQGEMSTAKPGPQSGSTLSLPGLEKFLTRIGGRGVSIRREHIMQPLIGVACLILLVLANFYFVVAPAEQRLSDSASTYDTVASSSLASAKASPGNPATDESAILWADNLLAIGKALAPRMKLERLELVPAAGKPGAGADLTLAITGALPPDGENLKLVAGFIERLSQDKSFSRRFAQVRFTGAGASEDEMHREMLFHVVGLSGSAKK